MMALNLDRGRQGHGRRRRLPRHSDRVGRRRRRHRLLHGRRPRPRARPPSGPTQSRRCAPYYGVIPWPTAQPDWSKLEAHGAGALRRERRLLHPGQGRGSSRRSCSDLGKDAEFVRPPRRRPRLLQRHPPRGLRRRKRPSRRGSAPSASSTATSARHLRLLCEPPLRHPGAGGDGVGHGEARGGRCRRAGSRSCGPRTVTTPLPSAWPRRTRR